jgi:multidrug efflux pump subunit AcrA (membrane-fusion protein)
MKIPKVIPIIVLIFVVAVGFKTVVLRKPDTRLIYTAQEETFLETVQVGGIFHKTATETERATAYAAYQSAISALTTARQNKEAADAAMWSKRQVVLDAENSVNYKNDNTTNPTTKEDYTDLEKLSIDSKLVQAEKDFLSTETKYKEANISIAAAQAQINLAKIAYEESLESEALLTVYINEIYVPKVKVGQKVSVTFDSMKDKVFSGKVTSIDSVGTVDGGVVTFETKIEIADLPTDIKPNMTAIATIELIRKENAYSLPSSAIIYRNGKTYVQKLDSADGELTAVELGEKGFAKVEIVSGLENGTQVLVRPTSKSL